MGRVYATVFENVAVTALQELFAIEPGTDATVKILSFHISQLLDVGDTEEEMLRLKLIRGHTTDSTTGGTANETPIETGGAAATYVGGINRTGGAINGTPVDLFAGMFNIRVGIDHVFTPEQAPTVNAGDGSIVLRLMANPTDSLTMSGTIYVEEQ